MKTWILAGLVAGVASAAWAQAPAPAAVPDPLWKTTVAAGANVTRGNSETLQLNGSVVSVFKQDKYNSEPAPGKDEHDLRLIAGVTYKL